MGMIVSLVVAAARNGVIGGEGRLLWRIRDDLKWFKAKTMGKPMIMGRKTWDSIGLALPGRDSIVMTRDPAFAAPGAFVVRSAAGALELAEACARARGGTEVCVIGGGEIYRQFLAKADRIYLTRVDAAPAGDAVFPPLDPGAWFETRESAAPQNAQNEHACEFFILERRRA